MKKLNLLFFAFFMLFALQTHSQNADQIINEMGYGFNLGNSWDNGEQSRVFTDLKPYIDSYIDVGAGHVRIPVTWMTATNDGQVLVSKDGNWITNINSPSNNFLEQLKLTINYCIAQGLYVVINTHHEEWLKDHYGDALGTSYYDQRFARLWEFIATEFQSYSKKLIFEVLNEPEGVFGQWGTSYNPTDNFREAWTRDINLVGYNAIRDTGGNNETRLIMISPNAQGNDGQLANVYPNAASLPRGGNDSNLAIHVHSYDPWLFCGQDGSNTGFTTSGVTSAVASDINGTANYAQNTLGVPVNYGEFGVGSEFDQPRRNTTIVKEYYRTFVETCIANDIAVTAWEDRGWFRLINNAGNSWTYGIVPYMLANVDGGTTPPASGNVSVSFTTPANNASFDAGEAVVVNVAASHSSGISNVRLSVDGNFIRQENIAPYDWGTNDTALTSLSSGNHTLSATATAADGSTATVTRTISVGSSSPTGSLDISFTRPTSSSVQEGETMSVEIVEAQNQDINVALTLNGVALRNDNVPPHFWGGGEAQLQNLAPGDYTLRAVASLDSNSSVTDVATFNFTVQGNGTFPDPTKTYWIDNVAHNVRLAASGNSEDAYTTSVNNNWLDTRWKFVQVGNLWHLERAAGGSLPRLRADNTANADMDPTSSSWTWTRFELTPGAVSGAYYLTLSTSGLYRNRLMINSSGAVTMAPSTAAGGWVQFRITETGIAAKSSSGKLQKKTISENFQAYPNPVKDVLHVSLPNTKGTSLEMYSILGKRVYKQSVKGLEKIEINVSKFSKGIYFVRLYGAETLNKKISIK